MYEGDSETPFTGVVVSKHDNGQKKWAVTYKNGKRDGLMTQWLENGQKNWEVTHKAGKVGDGCRFFVIALATDPGGG